jgi:hypothetical protein
MRFRTKLSALLAVLLFAFTFLGGTGVGAQDDMEGELEIGDLEGIQYGVARTYTVDYSALMEDMSTPGAELEMPSGLISMSAMVIEFDNSDNAEAAIDQVTEDIGSEEMGLEGVEEIDLDLGDNSTSFAGVEEYDGIESDLVVTVVQKDNYAYLVYAASSEIDLQETVKEFTNTLIDNDGSGEGEFSEDGTSTGGLWDKFPGSDNEIISGLTAFDMVLYPETEDGEEG